MRIRIVVVAALTLATAGPARAANDPRVTDLFPEDGGTVRSIQAELLYATFDRGLRQGEEEFALKDRNGAAVPGTVFLMGPVDGAGQERTVGFRPAGALSESLSPYLARARACPIPAGDCASIPWTFSVDDTAPLPPQISTPAPDAVDRNQPSLVRGSAEPGARIVILEHNEVLTEGHTNDDGSFSVIMPYGPEDGVRHTLRVYARDDAGNLSGASQLTYIHDSVTVRPVITAPDQNAAFNTTEVQIGGSAKPNTTIEVHELGDLVATAVVDQYGRWRATGTFAPGTHTVTATSFDGYTLDGPSNSRTFIVDLTPPAPPAILRPAAGEHVGRTGVEVSGTAEPAATVRIREGGVVVGQAAVGATGAWSVIVDMTDGPHTITAETVDPAGNVSPQATRSFLVDTAAPPSPIVSQPINGSHVNTPAVTISGTAEPGATVEIREGGGVRGSTIASGAGAWSITLGFTDGTHVVVATAIDPAGNRSRETTPLSFTVDTIAPAAPVILTPPQNAPLSHREVYISGTAEPSAAVAVFEGTTRIAFVPSDHEGNWAVLVTLTTGPHTIVARVTDLAGNTGPDSAPRAFSIGSDADTVAPSAPAISQPPQNSVQPSFVVFRGQAEPGATVRLLEGSSEFASTSAGPSGQWTIGETMQNGVHTITATATDPAGNRSLPSAPRTFRVDATRPRLFIDTLPLSIFVPGVLPPEIVGRATDDSGVARIELLYTDRITNQVVLTHDASSCAACPGTSVAWSTSPPLGPGVYRIDAWAIDVVGNRSEPGSIHVIVI